MKKQFKLIIMVLFFVSIYSGCGIKGGTGTGMFEKNSDKITISTSDGTKFDITDENVMDKIRNMCKNCDWTDVPREEQSDGECEIWIDFNNDWAVIGMYKDKDYGNLEKTKEEIGHPKYLPKGLNQYVKKLIEESKKYLIEG
jgi:predicted small lipoprotein YifL